MAELNLRASEKEDSGIMSTMANGLQFYGTCRCADGGCGAYLMLTPARCDITFTSVGWSAAQHSYTMACAGHHGPGPCPPSSKEGNP